jgi:hypothetical protein
MVGAAGFEPTTLCPPDKCATRLRYAPTARRHRETGDLAQPRFLAKRNKLRFSTSECIERWDKSHQSPTKGFHFVPAFLV